MQLQTALGSLHNPVFLFAVPFIRVY